MSTHFPRNLSDFRHNNPAKTITSPPEEKRVSEPFDEKNKDTLENINFKDTTSYHVEEPPEPPPQNRKLGQQERRQLIIALIKENQIGKGASIEKVYPKPLKKDLTANKYSAISSI